MYVCAYLVLPTREREREREKREKRREVRGGEGGGPWFIPGRDKQTRAPIERERGERGGRCSAYLSIIPFFSCSHLSFFLSPYSSLSLALSFVTCAVRSFPACIRFTYLSALPSFDQIALFSSRHLSCLFLLHLRAFFLTFSF